MASVALQIVAPVHDAYLADADPVTLRGQLASGSAAGLFFRWYSTLHPAATASQPELNAVHGAASLSFATALDVGSHVITLAAADQDGTSQAAIRAITRAGFTGGAPAPGNASPCVVHRLRATLKTPASDGAALSKASATLEFRAPIRWCKEDPAGSGIFVPDPDYRAVHKLQYRFELRPDGAPDPAHTASVVVDLASTTFFIDSADHKTYARWRGALPAVLGTGAHVLTLFVEKPDRSIQHAASRRVALTA